MVVRNKKPAPIGKANIKVVGVGGGGSNAVSRMFLNRIPEIEYISINTDAQALSMAKTHTRLRVGDTLARGLGVGGDPIKGRECHEENREEIKDLLKSADLVFIAAGMGGGTGTGGAPIVAEVAKEIGALAIGVVTKPFEFEGTIRKRVANAGIEKLSEQADTLIVIPNERLNLIADETISMNDCFNIADDVLRQGVQSISELILVPGEINLDFADVQTVMAQAGQAWMAIGKGSGENKALKAAAEAIESPLLEVSIEGARGVIFNVTGGPDLTLDEVQDAAQFISQMVAKDAKIFFGTAQDPKMENEVKITVIATGFPRLQDEEEEERVTDSSLKEIMADQKRLSLPPFMRFRKKRLRLAPLRKSSLQGEKALPYSERVESSQEGVENLEGSSPQKMAAE